MGVIGNKKGLGLLEVMIAMVVFLIGGAALFSLIVTMVKMNRMTNERNYARLIAEQIAENLRSVDYKSPELENDGDNNDLDDIQNADHSSSTTREGKLYNIYWNIAEDTPKEGVKTIRVIVTHKNIDYRVTTLKGKIRR